MKVVSILPRPVPLVRTRCILSYGNWLAVMWGWGMICSLQTIMTCQTEFREFRWQVCHPRN